MPPSVYVPILSYFVLLQSILGTVNVPNYCSSPFCLSRIPSPPTEFALPQRVEGTVNKLNCS